MRRVLADWAATLSCALILSCSSGGADEPAVSSESDDGSSVAAGDAGVSPAEDSAESDSAGTDGSETAEDVDAESVKRPQLSDAEAAEQTVLDALATRGSVVNPTDDPWDPTQGLPSVDSFVADYVVAAEGGTHATVQSAVDEAMAAGGAERVYIAIEPGSYRELVCIAGSDPPITLYGTGADASETRIVYDNYNSKEKPEDEVGQPCMSSAGKTSYGTSGSATFVVKASEFQAKNLTIENDTDESGISGSLQAVALLTLGDRIVFDEVRLLGNQDTFYAKAAHPAIAIRVYVEDSFIAGDTDFIFGDARLAVRNSTLHVVGDRRSDGVILAPSTHALNAFGFVIQDSEVTADENVTSVKLGRAWDESQGDLESYLSNVERGDYPNGMAVVRETLLDAPIAAEAWSAAATTGRPFSSVDTDAPKNRLYEYANSGPGSVE